MMFYMSVEEHLLFPDYIPPAGANEGDPSIHPSTYLLDPNFISADQFAAYHEITKANKIGTDWYHETFKPVLSKP
jgi:hypothetical protein